MYCPYCGKTISDDTTYCPYCGREVKKRAPAHKKSNNDVLIGVICGLVGVLIALGVLFIAREYKHMHSDSVSKDGVYAHNDKLGPNVDKPHDIVTTAQGAHAAYGQQMHVVSSVLRLRSLPKEDSQIICELHYGNSVQVLDGVGAWSHVRVLSPAAYQGCEGYVANVYLIDNQDYELASRLFSANQLNYLQCQSYYILPLLNYCKKYLGNTAWQSWYLYNVSLQGNEVAYYLNNKTINESRYVLYRVNKYSGATLIDHRSGTAY